MNNLLLLGYTLLCLSWGMKLYGAIIEKRGPLYTPLLFAGPVASLVLMMIFITAGFTALVLAYVSAGWWHLLIMLGLYFIVFPLVIGSMSKTKKV